MTRKDAYVIITYVDGNKIFNYLKNDKYEIYYNKEPIYGVYKYNDNIPNEFNKNFKMLFYFKDVYGLQNGSEEYLVNNDYLINKFKKYNFVEEHHDNFLNIYKNNVTRFKLNYEYQRKIMDIYKISIFKKE